MVNACPPPFLAAIHGADFNPVALRLDPRAKMLTEEMKAAILEDYHRRNLLAAPESARDAIVRDIQILSAIRVNPRGESVFRVLAHSRHPAAKRILREVAL